MDKTYTNTIKEKNAKTKLTKEKFLNNPNRKIKQLKKQLENMDYMTSKHADGDYTSKEWAEIVKKRKSLRAEIKQLEEEIKKEL